MVKYFLLFQHNSFFLLKDEFILAEDGNLLPSVFSYQFDWFWSKQAVKIRICI